MIYIKKVFNLILEAYFLVISFSFVDNLGFIILESLVKDITLILEKVAKTVLQLDEANVVIYDIAKIKAVFFSKSYQ